jgi:hypothetical protein
MTDIADFIVYIEDKIYRLHKCVIFARCSKLLEAEGKKNMRKASFFRNKTFCHFQRRPQYCYQIHVHRLRCLGNAPIEYVIRVAMVWRNLSTQVTFSPNIQ